MYENVFDSDICIREGPKTDFLGLGGVGWGKTFWRVGRVPLTKTDVTRKRKVAH